MSTINPDLLLGNIVMTRVRLARNLNGYPFRVLDEKIAREIVKKVNEEEIVSSLLELIYE